MLDWDSQNRTSEEVIHSTKQTIDLDTSDLHHLKKLAVSNSSERMRYCSHHHPDEVIQEMFIVHSKHAYVRPHMHINKIESMLVLKGQVDYVTLAQDGSVEEVIPMGNLESGKVFYHSMRKAAYHTLLIRSEWLFFLEITKGPFNREDTIFAKWSPEIEESSKISEYINNLERKICDEILQS
jgi:cupin fold WbuC family metalloprotein